MLKGVMCLTASNFSVNEHYLLKNGQTFLVKGVVYVPAYPGHLPENLIKTQSLPDIYKKSILNDMSNIRDMGANTIRFWDVPDYCYEAVGTFQDLYFIQTIWLPVEQSDFQDGVFKEQCKKMIQETVGRIYQTYTRENPPPILAYVLGNELSVKSIENTDKLHPEINEYSGKWVQAPKGSTATQCFLAELADHLKNYENEKYGQRHLVSYANEVRSYDVLETPFLDFRSFNTYTYAILDYTSPRFGSHTQTIFQGWIEYLKAKYPKVPLLITETGLSISPNAEHKGPPEYGYGGNTEEEQAQCLSKNWEDIITAQQPIAGVCVHEYLDSWWKFSLEDSLQHDPDDVEEWYGLVSFERDGDWYKTTYRKSYLALKSVWNNTTSPSV